MPDDCIIDVAPPFAGWDFHIVLDADWHDLFPQFLDANEDPLDLTDVTLGLFVRPRYGHETLLLFLSTAQSPNELIIDDAINGLVSVHVPKDDIQAAFESPGVWQWFLRMVTGGAYDEIARGNFYVHPGVDTTP